MCEIAGLVACDVKAAVGQAVVQQMRRISIIDLRKNSMQTNQENPRFGVGFGNLSILSGMWHVTHNTCSESSASAGIPALIFFVPLQACPIGNTERATKNEGEESEILLLGGALRSSLVGFLVGVFFSSAAYHLFAYLFAAYNKALVMIAKVTSEKGPVQPRQRLRNKWREDAPSR